MLASNGAGRKCFMSQKPFPSRTKKGSAAFPSSRMFFFFNFPVYPIKQLCNFLLVSYLFK